MCGCGLGSARIALDGRRGWKICGDDSRGEGSRLNKAVDAIADDNSSFLTLHRIRSKLFLKILLAPLFLRTIQISSALHTLGSCTHRCATYNQRTMVINHHRIGLALGPSIIPRCELLHTPEIRILLVLSPRIIRMRDVKKKLQKLQN